MTITTPSTAAAAASSPGDTLGTGQTLHRGESLTSRGGFTRLTLGRGGDLVLSCRRAGGWTRRWSSGTNGQGATRLTMRRNGNLVLLRGNTRVWQSGTHVPGARLVVTDVEDAVVRAGGRRLWATATTLNQTPVKGDGPEVYLLTAGVRRWIPDPETLDQRFGGWGAVTVVLQGELERWRVGEPVPSVRPPAPDQVRLCVDQDGSTGGLPPRQGPPPPPPRIQADGSVVGVAQGPLTGVTEKMWDVGATLRVELIGGSAFVRGKVREFAEQWTQHANIHFDWVADGGHIRTTFEPTGNSWSHVGRDALGIPFGGATMNFGWFTDETDDPEFSRTVLHEFGHALGLVHEHQSPAAGIAWDREKVYAHFAEQGWDRAKVDHNVFERYEVSQTNFSAFDPTSIMEYHVPADITLDGHGVVGGTVLSAMDRDWIRRWYPFPPTPANAVGLLRTGDDCDEIDFLVEYGVVDGDNVGFRLRPASGLDWWKAVEVPVGGSDWRMLEMQDGASAEATVSLAERDVSRPLRFWKAKAFGIHTKLGFTWDVLSALPAGARLTLTWKRDHC